MQAKNPYTQASDAYGRNSVATALDQRALEGQILMRAAQKLEDLAKKMKAGEKPTIAEIDEAIEYNRKLWIVFASETGNPDNPLPDQLKSNIANLAIFIFKRSMQFLADPTADKLAAIIDINRQIASGLLKKQAAVPQPATAEAAPVIDSQA